MVRIFEDPVSVLTMRTVDAGMVSTLVMSAAFAGAHVGGALLPWSGVHDWLVPGTSGSAHPAPSRSPSMMDPIRAGRLWCSTRFAMLAYRRRSSWSVSAPGHFPTWVRRIAGEGHAIGNHGWQHLTLATLGPRRMADEIDRCQDALNHARRPRAVSPSATLRASRLPRLPGSPKPRAHPGDVVARLA